MYFHPQISTSVAYRQTLLLAYQTCNDTLSALTLHHLASVLNPSFFPLFCSGFFQMDKGENKRHVNPTTKNLTTLKHAP